MIDHSTLDLSKWYEYQLPPSYGLSQHRGMGCFLEPPGHTTYFLQPIYNRAGNRPPQGPESGIMIEDVLYVPMLPRENRGLDWVEATQIVERRIEEAWLPLTPHHRRVRAWVRHVAAYFWPNLEAMHRLVGKYYPGFAVPPEWLRPRPLWGKGEPGEWYAREDSRPLPEECPGDVGLHPDRGDWCQYCGYVLIDGVWQIAEEVTGENV